MSFLRRQWKLFAIGASCTAIGAGASVIASAGAATNPATNTAAKPAGHGARTGHRHLLGRAVHGDLIVHTKAGFVTVTFDRGAVKSVNGQQLTLTEGTRTATYKTLTLTIPSGARVRDNGQKAALADVKPGQRAMVVQGPKQTSVIARDVRAGGAD
jgi:hypothetical protein